MGQAVFREATIPAGAGGGGVSNWMDLRGEVVAAITMPPALTSATQIVLEHAWAADGSGGGPLIVWPDTAQLVIPFVAGATILLPAGNWATLGWLRVVAGTSGNPVQQAAARRFIFGRRPA